MSHLFTLGGQKSGTSASASGSISLRTDWFDLVVQGSISLRTDWFDLVVQGTLKSLLQCHNSKASILQHSAAFMVQLLSLSN